jgi:hypothetical protein
MKEFFAPLGLNEADTLKCSSILIYKVAEQSIYLRGKALIWGTIKKVNELNC